MTEREINILLKDRVIKIARNFKTKHLKNDVSIDSIIHFLNCMGFSVYSYSDDEGSPILTQYGLRAHANNVKAFTFIAHSPILTQYGLRAHANNVEAFTFIIQGELKMVFIKKGTTHRERLYLLLHEIGHILLKHIGGDSEIAKSDGYDEEIEANAFAYAVLNL